jgi:uncharacterized protein YifE (UPF0438 family)
MNNDIFNLLEMGLTDYEAGFKQVPRNEDEQTVLKVIQSLHELESVSRHTIGNYVTLLRADRCLSATGGKPEDHCGQSGCPFMEVLS